MMKFIDILCAKPSLEKLASENLPLPLAYKVYKTIEKVNRLLAFYGSERSKAQDEESVSRLNDSDAPEDIDQIEIPLNLNIELTASDINYLMPFVSFKEVDHGNSAG